MQVRLHVAAGTFLSDVTVILAENIVMAAFIRYRELPCVNPGTSRFVSADAPVEWHSIRPKRAITPASLTRVLGA